MRKGQCVKRGIDLALAVPTLVASLPLQACVAIAIYVKLGRPILFRQLRPGYQGKSFVLIKFRTMQPKDEIRGLVDDANRLTSLGRALRATSLDELPSLINVVLGDMSLVGPRPLLTEYLQLYSSEQARRHDVPPGLTGLAQVSGRNSLSWEDKLRMDIWYVDNHSNILDVQIMLRTLSTVLQRKGINALGSATMPQFRGTAGLH